MTKTNFTHGRLSGYVQCPCWNNAVAYHPYDHLYLLLFFAVTNMQKTFLKSMFKIPQKGFLFPRLPNMKMSNIVSISGYCSGMTWTGTKMITVPHSTLFLVAFAPLDH